MPLQQLAPEEALETVHRAVQPKSHRLRTIQTPWQKLGRFWAGLTGILSFVFFLGYVWPIVTPSIVISFIVGLLMILWVVCLVLAPVLFLVSLFFNAPRDRAIEEITSALSPILPHCRLTESVPLLLDFLAWLEPSAPIERTRSLHDALVHLLPRVGEAELAEILTPCRRKALRLVCTKREDIELAKIALLVLASVQDKATIPLAQRLRKSPLTCDAAEAFLDAMQATTP